MAPSGLVFKSIQSFSQGDILERFSYKALRLGASIQMWSLGSYRGGVCEDRLGAAPCQTELDPTVLPRDTDEDISHHQVWENIFKKGHKMPQSKEDREETERMKNSRKKKSKNTKVRGE